MYGFVLSVVGRRSREGGAPMGRIRRTARGDGGRARHEVVDLRELVVEHHADLFRYARSFTRNDADAEDLAQTAVVRALGAGTELRDPERAKWYLLRIVRNLATDQARSRARVSVEPWADVPDAAAVELEPEALVLRADAGALPRAAFADLPARHQEVLHLRFVEELDYEAVAARLHTTEHAARQRVYRAMQALRVVAESLQLGTEGAG
jgi:RNA polymerase sigma-70 factor (ECF subfamily)